MSGSETSSPTGEFEVGVAIVAIEDGVARPSEDDQPGGRLPGYDEAFGLKLPSRHSADQAPALVVKGGEAVKIATEAIAGQIGLAAQRIASAIEAQALATPAPGVLSLESVAVSFGITLTAGVQALFTAQANSSAQVSITLTRHPGPGN